MVYSIAERVEIIELFFKNDECGNRVAELFNQRHPDKHTSGKIVRELVTKFRETGSVHNKKRQLENRVLNEPTEIAVLGQVAVDSTLSTRQLAIATGVSRTSVQRVLKKYKFHPYKIRLVHELNEDDFDRRLQFCEVMSERALNNGNFLFNVCFSDESSFFLNGLVNRHNCRYWADTNPRIFHASHTQHPQKLNVWAGIFGNSIVGPFFIPGNLTGDMYLDLLQNAIDPALTHIIENDPAYNEQELIFQQDGAPPHYSQNVRNYLNDTFPGRWIGRRGTIEWPPRSPDLSPLDFFVGTHKKPCLQNTTRHIRRVARKNY